ncbi:MAG: HD domain-containing phosphohydrolase [Burkholderiaceae bacterium]
MEQDSKISGLQKAAAGATVLFVDDEVNILSALRRLFRHEGYRTLTAESAQAGLMLLEDEPVDLVVSDMRMPGMNGAAFLEQVRAKWPDTVRLLLTGHADVQSILQAVNRGEISRYITKPWDEHEILLIVRQALERRALELERRRLEGITRTQNEELLRLNATLEEKVLARTADLKKAHERLTVSNEKLRVNFLTSIKIFAGLLEMRHARLAGHSRRVADLSRKIAQKMELSAAEIQEIFIAALLHNIGKIGFSDDLLAAPVSVMRGDDLVLYRKYPQRGEQLLMPLDDLRGAAAIVRAHQERFDGSGFPDGLSGMNIPLGARILGLASDYYSLQVGVLSQRCLRPDEAVTAILGNTQNRYDPAVVRAFRLVAGRDIAREEPDVMQLKACDLQPGMIVARDLVMSDGFLLLSAGHVLSERLIKQIAEFAESSSESITVCVHQKRGEA